eukprot:7110323-Alexandrium_andersonii.AAC.1
MSTTIAGLRINGHQGPGMITRVGQHFSRRGHRRADSPRPPAAATRRSQPGPRADCPPRALFLAART